MRNPIVAFLFFVFCSGVSLAQNSVREQSQPEQIPVAKQSDLMEHSGMQAPKAIPSVKLLRFQEIPVGILLDNAVLDDLRTASPLPAEQQTHQATARSGDVATNTSEQPTGAPTSGQH
jgi:hypothetical protein